MQHIIFDVAYKRGLSFGRMSHAPESVVVQNNTFSNSLIHFFFDNDTPLPKPGFVIENNILSQTAIAKPNDISDDTIVEKAKLAAREKWRVGHNCYLVDPKSVGGAIPAGPIDRVDTAKFLTTDSSHRDYLRLSPDSELATAGVGGELPEYIGALPPGPAPKDGDWFTRLLDRWREVEQNTQKTDGGAAK